MDSRIKHLISNRGGYAYEIAGRVTAFFRDPNESRAFKEFLHELTDSPIQRLGSELSFPSSTRLDPRRLIHVDREVAALPQPSRLATWARADISPVLHRQHGGFETNLDHTIWLRWKTSSTLGLNRREPGGTPWRLPNTCCNENPSQPAIS